MNNNKEDPLVSFGRHLAALDELLRDPGTRIRIGPGIERELRGALVSFRQKFPHALPGAQPPLL